VPRRGTTDLTTTESALDMRNRNTARALALLGMGLDLIARGDPAKALAAAYAKDPLGFLERVAKLGVDPNQQQNPSSINNLFVLAAKQAAATPLPIIDVEAEPARVQSGFEGEQPIDW
jgi:hypothetical protein